MTERGDPCARRDEIGTARSATAEGEVCSARRDRGESAEAPRNAKVLRGEREIVYSETEEWNMMDGPMLARLGRGYRTVSRVFRVAQVLIVR